ncbi:FAD-dependent oxidoreductase [Ravibacter arvi]|uniref:FAD-dependent oxidoreductase n=1 Tax=Ravibacter arvi TaxID=2051041 RepID=A0ABP8LM24_9BACT
MKEQEAHSPAEGRSFEAVIVGGSYAGLSAAMALGRALRKVLIIDSALPCNRQTPHSHNFITHDGEKPGAIAEKARAQVLKYDTVTFRRDEVVGGTKSMGGFELTTRSGATFNAEKLIFATGIKDTMPAIKGFAACWGISVIHCPYCHGYEYRGQNTGIMANGEKALHLASLVNNLTGKITILTSGQPDFSSGQLEKLDSRGIQVVSTPVSEIEHDGGHVRSVVFEDGRKMELDAVYAAIPFTQHSDLPFLLGCELTEHGRIKVDAGQKTTVNGIFACGDNSSPMRSVASAVSTGNIAGAMLNHGLTMERF